MLTPQQVKNHRFQLGSRGTYRAEEVDAFVQELTVSFEEAYTQNEALLKKISLLADKVEEYRRDEDTIRSALLVAQRTADQVVREAQEKADASIAQAESHAKALETEASASAGKALQEASDRAQALTREVDARVSELLSDASAKAESLVSEAQVKADRLVEEAGRQAQENLAQLRGETERESLLLDQTRAAVSEFRANLIAMYKEHIELINRLPSLPEDAVAASAGENESRPEEPAYGADEPQDTAQDAALDEAAPEQDTEQQEEEPAVEETPADEPPFAQAEDDLLMAQFRTVYREEEAAQASAEGPLESVQEETAQLTMGEPGFHLNLAAVADDEPPQGQAPGGISEDGVPTFEGFFKQGNR